MTNQANRRRTERSIINVPVNYRIGNTRISSYSYDLCPNGMFMETEVLPVEENEVVPLEICLLDKGREISSFGRVVYRHTAEDDQRKIKSRGVGIEFLHGSEKDEARIAEYLARIPSVSSSANLSTLKVETREELDQFIDLPYDLYKDNPYWIPPLKKDMRSTLTAENPFLRHGEMDLFLVKDGNRPVGRIAAIVDHDFIKLHSEMVGYFGFFECLPDFNVAKRLFDIAGLQLKSKGMIKARGPMSPSLNDEICFLLEGVDSYPNIMTPYNPLYYNNFARGYGMYKLKDFLSLTINLERTLPESLLHTLKKCQDEGVEFRKLNMKRFSDEVELLRRLNNQSWTEAGHWGFVPITAEEMGTMADHFRSLVDPDIIYFAQVSGKPAGYVLNLPNFYPALRYLKGKPNPLGIIRLLHYLRHIKNVRAVSVGVLNEFGGRSIALSLFVKSILEMQKKGYESMEYVWVLEDNEASLGIASKFNGRLLKRYRMYEYPLMDNLAPCYN